MTGEQQYDQNRSEPFGWGEPATPPDGPSENERLLSGLAYASQIVVPALLPVILLAGEDTRRKRFMRYHAVHSLALLVVDAVYLAIAALIFLLASATVGCLGCVLWVLFLAPAGVLLYYGWQAYRGRQDEIPYLTPLLRDNGWL